MGKTGFLLDRLQAYWQYGSEHGSVLGPHCEVTVWWNPKSETYRSLRSPLLDVEF